MDDVLKPGGESPDHDPVAAGEAAAERALSPSTKRAIELDWRKYCAWCEENDMRALPGSAETVAAFVAATAQEHKPASVRRYLATVEAVHRAAGLDEPGKSDPVRRAIARMHQQHGRRQRQAVGITWALATRMLAASGDRLIDVRNCALLSLAYDTLMRRSELVDLEFGDVVVENDGTARVFVKRSKTDPEGEGAELWAAPDTVAIVQDWLERARVSEGAIFRSVVHNIVGRRLDGGEVPRIYRDMARVAGLPARIVKAISGHSTRVGAAQDMVAAGVSMAAILQAGRWTSEASVLRYVQNILAGRNGAAQLARIQRRW